jgi:serine/threonine-protein kinase
LCSEQRTQLALSRPVALKVIAPEWAADEGYRERFQRESQVTASIDHPNVIPVYEAGELDGRLYLMMRWVEGTDLRALLSDSGCVPSEQAIRLLRPVASALAAAHRRGLVHRDIKPANVLIAQREEQHEDHVYLTDFGIARLTDGESITRTGLFVGTVDYMAPERLQGAKGDAASDIYSFGCMLFEVLTGHVPFDRPSNVAKIFAHVSDPIPSAEDAVAGVPAALDAIIASAMAKRPQDRFSSAGQLMGALEHALQELDTAERSAQLTAAPPDAMPPAGESTETDGIAAAVTEPIGARTEPAATRPQPSATETAPTTPSPLPIRGHERRPMQRIPRRSLTRWLAPIAVLGAAGVLIAVLANGSSDHRTGGGAPAPATASNRTGLKIRGSGLSHGWTIDVSGRPGSIAVGSRNVWISLPNQGELVRFNPLTGRRRIFSAPGQPTGIAAGFSALWVAETASRSLAQFNGDSGALTRRTPLSGTPTAVAVDQNDSSAWVADSSGKVSHVALGGGVIGEPAHIAPAAMSIAWGEGWLWAANGADHGLVRVSLGTAGSNTTYDASTRPVAVTLDLGVWTAHATGQVTRFNPLPYQLRVNGDVTLPGQARLDRGDGEERVRVGDQPERDDALPRHEHEYARSHRHRRVPQPARRARRGPALGLGRNAGRQSHRDPFLNDEVRLLQHRSHERRDRALANPGTLKCQPAWHLPHLLLVDAFVGMTSWSWLAYGRRSVRQVVAREEQSRAVWARAGIGVASGSAICSWLLYGRRLWSAMGRLVRRHARGRPVARVLWSGGPRWLRMCGGLRARYWLRWCRARRGPA